MTYIKFEIEIKKTEKTFLKTVVRKFLFAILPKANPDFENKIELVNFWYLEFEDENQIPVREIGVNAKNEVVLKMPFKKNYGYWTDNLLKYDDFNRLFKITKIEEETFKKLWESLV